MVGLPAAGKSAVAEDLARALDCAVLSVDPVKAAMWRSGVGRDQPTGLADNVRGALDTSGGAERPRTA